MRRYMSQKAWMWPGRYPRMVRQMLIKRSQLQPVINAAAAGGKRIATRMRQTSEALTVMFVVVEV